MPTRWTFSASARTRPAPPPVSRSGPPKSPGHLAPAAPRPHPFRPCAVSSARSKRLTVRRSSWCKPRQGAPCFVSDIRRPARLACSARTVETRRQAQMRFRFSATRALAPMMMSVLGLGTLASGVAVASATAATAATAHHSDTGWIRLAHLSPNTPPVDVYLYSFGNSHAMIVLHHVAYGTVSPYERVKAGEYTVAMRGAGAKPSSQPVLSASVQITAGGAYTVAGMGPAKGLRLQVIPDRLTTPPGKSLVRVIAASLRYQKITVKANHRTLAKQLDFAHVTSYVSTPAGSFDVHFAGMGGKGSANISLAAGTIHTLVVLDSHNGLQIANLEDAAGSTVMPSGGAATGLGGTAPAPGPSPVLWVSLVAVGGLITAAGAYRMRQMRSVARHAR